jgi:hypothetical protein
VQLKVSGKALTAAAVLVAAAGGAVIARADDESKARGAQAAGGLSVSPVKIEQPAVGVPRVVTVANNSRETLTVAVTARPWTQSSSGLVSPNRRSTLPAIAVSEGAFTLAPKTNKQVTVTQQSAPAGGSLYGALEVVGLPSDIARRKGVVAGYRIVGAVRLNPATPTYSIKAGSAKVVASGETRMLALTLRNAGNTLEPVSGTVRLRGPLGTRQASVRATKILPGKSIALALVSVKGLPAGSYTAAVTLRQGSERINLSKRIRVRR